ncbi:hypothetical protein [Streptomyces sp. NPDC014006]|uniref:hypothetical protein n=1 Tax=Streptomyces sp. NPDC014006 TaxID=3364870 RepID=UPI0037020A21
MVSQRASNHFWGFLHERRVAPAAGAVGLVLLSVGIKARRPALSSAGAVVLALLVAGPALSS